ncbi:bifunctional adenosylcobinamide kinase/adenosylcobinamide-phosphate guanylyltransferase [Bacillaceae bacterium Marseille-Q3522]|nr:bifunctional adenosylcobinamide kinase/adenosylcobinamide-phosphate guanylyltransferase [Bacillaceae bacterium Marseille-Q3522]
MHFVIGGAYNGKSAWTKTFFHLQEENCCWLSAYRQMDLPVDFHHLQKDFFVLEGVEQWIKQFLQESGSDEVREKWHFVMEKLSAWETGKKERTVIFIGSDITKGIVPNDAKDRKWRDVSGRVFQDTASYCQRVDLIWYGLNRILKDTNSSINPQNVVKGM